MSTVSYQLQGRTLNLDIVKTHLYEKESVYDESRTDLLYVRHMLDIQCVYSPGATAYVQDETGLPAAAPGVMGATTDVAIRQFLMSPRGTLLYRVGDVEVIRSPMLKPDGVNSYDTDARNGPLPLKCSVVQVSGQRLFLVRWVVETCLTDCSAALYAKPSALLSNRWSDSHVVDGRHCTTRTVQGVAVFRADLLRDRSLKADDFRSQIVLPIPPTFKREEVKIRVSPDGTRLFYEVTDRQRWLSLGANSPSVEIQGHAGVSSKYSGDTGAATFLNVSVAGVGHYGAAKYDVFRQCALIAMGRLNVGGVGNPPDVIMQAALREDFTEPNVMLEITAIRNPADRNKLGALPFQNGPPAGARDFLADDVGQMLQRAETHNPQPPEGKGTRGTYVGRAVAAALANPCDGPADPQAEPEAAAKGGATEDGPDILVVVSDDLPDPDTIDVLYANEALHADGVYTDYDIETSTITDSHVIQVPIAGATGPTSPGDDPCGFRPRCTLIGVADPTTRVVVRWTAKRYNDWPRIPKPEMTSSSTPLVLLRKRVSPKAPQVSAAGDTPLFQVTGEYHYAMPFSPSEFDDVRAGLNVTFTDQPELRWFPADHFNDNLIANSGGEDWWCDL